MKQEIFELKENTALTETVFRMVLKGDTSGITAPGQFVNIQLNGLYLRRPISVCDVDGDLLTLVYKVVGKGTEAMAGMSAGTRLDLLTGLGNGYDTSVSGAAPLLIGGGVGVPPLYLLAKKLRREGRHVKVILGFNTKTEIFYEEEFKKLGCEVLVTTADGSCGIRGFVTDALPVIAERAAVKGCGYSYIYTCGPEPMLKAVYKAAETDAQFSFEERMGCGFGACMGCTCKTVSGYKRICKDGPVLRKDDILWEA